jgi:hypothetical protein
MIKPKNIKINRRFNEGKAEIFTCSNSVEFLKSIIVQAQKYCKIMKDSCDETSSKYHPLNMTKEDEEDFKFSKSCHLCHKPLNGLKVRDHDHFTGAYRGLAHSECNTLCRNDRYNMDFFFHNGKNCDFHYTVKAISELCQTMKLKVSCIPLNTEKYLSISLKGEGFELTFKDTMQFIRFIGIYTSKIKI